MPIQGVIDNQQTTFQLTFGGIPFCLDDPEIIEFVENNIPLEDLREMILPDNPISGSIAKNLSGIAIPFHPERHKKRLGRFFYPTGLTRWGEFHGLMTTTQLNAVSQQLYNSDGSPKSLPFVIRSDVANAKDSLSSGGVTTQMFLLPPRYLGGWGSSKNSGGPSPFDELWLVTLVDDRYQGSYAAAAKIMPDGTMTWDTLVSTLAGVLGITINPALPAIESVYGKPSQDSPLWCMYESAAYLLEAAAQNVGRSVVRNFDGTYALPKYTDSASNILNNVIVPPMTLAGGDMYFKTFTASRPNLVLPNNFNITFPKFLQGTGYIDTRDASDKIKQSYGDVWLENVTLAQAGAPWTNYVGKGTRTLHDTARACYTASGDAQPNNETAIRALAVQMVQDYLATLQTAVDIVWPGIRAWVPEGLHDIIWTYRGVPMQTSTRVLRKPWNFLTQEFQHELGGCLTGGSTLVTPPISVDQKCCLYSDGSTVLVPSNQPCPGGSTPVPISQCAPNPFGQTCCKQISPGIGGPGTVIAPPGQPCPSGYLPVAWSECSGLGGVGKKCCKQVSPGIGGPTTIILPITSPCPSGYVQVPFSSCQGNLPGPGGGGGIGGVFYDFQDSCTIFWNNSFGTAGNVMTVTANWKGNYVFGSSAAGLSTDQLANFCGIVCDGSFVPPANCIAPPPPPAYGCCQFPNQTIVYVLPGANCPPNSVAIQNCPPVPAGVNCCFFPDGSFTWAFGNCPDGTTPGACPSDSGGTSPCLGIDTFRFNVCDFDVSIASGTCLGGVKITTQGSTQDIGLLDPNCKPITLCFVRGLFKGFR